MPGPARSTTRYAAGLVAAVALAGCGTGGDAPAVQTPVATSPARASTSVVTPSATPSSAVDPVLARIPAAARPETMEGALAYVAFYFDSLNDAFKRADEGLLTRLSKPDCKMCGALVRGVAEIRGQGRHYSADFLEISSPRPVKFTSSQRTVLVDVSQKSVGVLDSRGTRVDAVPSENGHYLATLDFSGRWFITRIQEVK